MRGNRAYLGAATIAALTPAIVHAQSERDTPATAQIQPSPAAAIAQATTPAAPGNAQGLDEILVVARRTSERLQDVPITVTAITGATIRSQSIRNATDLIKVVPTLNVTQSSQGPGQGYALRGIRTGVVTYFNDVPTATLAVDDQLWELASIQALSGPQGTLFGRNSTGGAVLFIPQRPTDKLEGFLEGRYGNYSERELEGVVNLPVTDTLKIRVGGRIIRRDGVVSNTIGPDLQTQHRNALRASILFEPSPIISNYTVVDYARRNEKPFGLITSHVRAGAGCFTGLGCFYGTQLTDLGAVQDQLGHRTIASGYPAFEKSREWGVSNVLTVTPADNVSLKYIFGFRNDQFDQFKSQTSVNLPAQIGHDAQTKGHTYSNELQVNAKLFDDRLNWTTGVFLTSDKQAGVKSYLLFGTVGVPFSDDLNTFQLRHNQRKSRAVYSQATYKITDNLNLTGGLRYTNEKPAIQLYSVGPRYTFFGPRVCKLPVAPDVNSATCIRTLSANQHALTYNLSLDYHPLRDVLLYATSRRGFNGGGFNASAPPNPAPGSPRAAYAPEHITDYEAGVKADWHLGTMPVRTNLSAYLSKYRDIQRGSVGVDTNGVPFQGIATGPKATLYGAQMEASIEPVPALLLTANYGYLHARYDATIAGFSEANGFAQAPTHTVNLSGTYTQPLAVGGDLVANASYVYQSKVSFADVNATSAYAYQNGYGLVDLRLDWNNVAGQKVDVGFYVKNVTNKIYALERNDLEALFGFVSSVYNDPRTYGVEVRVRFGQ